MTSTEIKQLQDKLVREGYMSQAEVNTGYGIFGPRTTAALNAAEAGKPPKYTPASGASNVNPTQGPSFTDQEASAAVAAHSIIKQYSAAGNSAADIENAVATGDISGLKNEYGQPFGLDEQKAALEQAQADTADYYNALKEKDKADTASSLAAKQAAYQDYLLSSGQNFEADKATADQSAADKGVLFSGGRVQKEQNLQRAYEQDQNTKLRNLTSDIGNTARDYQYKYGGSDFNESDPSGLGQYYKNIKQNTYNANVSKGGVGSSSLASIYNPSQYGSFGAGTVAGQKMTIDKQNATRSLANKANKLLSTGYNYKL